MATPNYFAPFFRRECPPCCAKFRCDDLLRFARLAFSQIEHSASGAESYPGTCAIRAYMTPARFPYRNATAYAFRHRFSGGLRFPPHSHLCHSPIYPARKLAIKIVEHKSCRAWSLQFAVFGSDWINSRISRVATLAGIWPGFICLPMATAGRGMESGAMAGAGPWVPVPGGAESPGPAPVWMAYGWA